MPRFPFGFPILDPALRGVPPTTPRALARLLGLLLLLAGAAPPTLTAQTVTRVEINCSGTFGRFQAEIQAVAMLRYTGSSTHIVWDGRLRVRDGWGDSGSEAVLRVEDYSNLPPYDATLRFLSGPYQGQTWLIELLEDYNGDLIVYDGRPSLKAPDEWGRFRCVQR